MTEKQPTQKQLKKFWEWCGLVEQESGSWYTDCFPAEYVDCQVPSLDLNNLFKYAVPKLEYAEVNYGCCQSFEDEDGKVISRDFTFEAAVSIGAFEEHNATCENKDPALALFWAIWKLIDKERE